MKKLIIALGLLAAANTNATVINFDGVTASNVNSFSVGDVTFTDSMGTGLSVSDYGHQSDGTALGIFGDDSSRLQLSFANTYDYLSFDFGNDNPGFGDPDGQMHLDLYLDGALTGSYALTANWDDIMNQTLSGTGLFNYAEIYYDTNLIEIVDNIEYRKDGEVPEPASIALFGLGLLGLGLSRKRK
ncbi:MAG: PEP-CTERM sorting domain-containing protein [Gammaproteobacteria bacterium]|nr:MAG: PEP-CTERM sorting domain-containing protein [Gammaproteobacteria bacterium]